MDEIEYYNDAYMLIYKNEYYYIYISREGVGHYEERSGVQYWVDKIDFLYSEAIEKSHEKPTILRLLKRVYQRYRECFKRTRGPQPIYEFTFYYNGERITEEGGTVYEEPDIDNMEFRYGCISDERCAEINSWRIPDPYGYGKKYHADGDYLVTNEDESILFFRAFSPRADEIEYYKKAYMLIYKNEYYYIYIARGYVGHYEERSGVQYWIDKIDFLYSEAIEKSHEKPTILRLLKRVYQRYRECFKQTRGPKPIYEFTFYYNGEEI